MKIFFYILTFLAAAPVGLYANIKYPSNYSIVNKIIRALFGVKLIFEILILLGSIQVEDSIIIIILYLVLLVLCYFLCEKIFILELTFMDIINTSNGIPLNKTYTKLQGEILEFKYKKKYSDIYENKRVLVDKVTLERNYIYIHGTDLDKHAYRTYRLDRALLDETSEN